MKCIDPGTTLLILPYLQLLVEFFAQFRKLLLDNNLRLFELNVLQKAQDLLGFSFADILADVQKLSQVNELVLEKL